MVCVGNLDTEVDGVATICTVRVNGVRPSSSLQGVR